MGRISRDSWAIIERVIRRYPESKKIYEDIYHNMVDTRPESLIRSENTKSGFPGKPIEETVIRMLDAPRMQRLCREIQAVEEVYNELPVEYQKVIQIRFWSNRHHNVPYLQMEQFVNYKEGQIKRISGEFIRSVGKKLGEL